VLSVYCFPSYCLLTALMSPKDKKCNRLIDHHTWHGLDSLVSSCVRSEHVAHVAPSCGPLNGFGGREGAVDPATEAHHSWLIEGGP